MHQSSFKLEYVLLKFIIVKYLNIIWFLVYKNCVLLMLRYFVLLFAIKGLLTEVYIYN
jgi:hypothetical protein